MIWLVVVFLPHLLIPCESRRGSSVLEGRRGARPSLNPPTWILYRLLLNHARSNWLHISQYNGYQATLLAEHIHASNYKGTGSRPLQCSLTPRFTGVSSKNVSPDPYYCHSRALAVTLGVKCTCSPAVHGCTPTAFPERINAFCNRCQPVVERG